MHIFNKKAWIFLSLIFLLILILACTLPLQSNVKETVRFSTTSDALFRKLVQDTAWQKWWPGEVKLSGGEMTFQQDGFVFTIQRILPNTFDLKTTSNSFSTNSYLHLFTEENKISVSLSTSIPIPYDPIQRIRTLFISSKLKAAYKVILSNLSNRFSDNKNLYDVDIKELSVQFEYVSTLSDTFRRNPSIKEIYSMIDQVKNHIKSKGGEEKGSPMLFTKQMDGGKYFAQVGIPTDKKLPDVGKIKSKWMLKGGNILSAEVTGNSEVVSKATKQIEYYIQDHHLSIIAISYEYLITNRLEQPDSSKWVTRIYYPVI